MPQPVYITDIAAFLPNAPVENETMEQVLGQIGPRPSRARKIILRSNGIQARHYAIDPQTRQATHTNAQLAASAIRKLIGAEGHLAPIDLLACGTSMPDLLMPNHAVMVHGELGNPSCEAAATAGICVSGMMAMKYGYLSVAAGESLAAVASGSENASAIMRSEYFRAEIDERIKALEANPEIAFEKDFLRWMLSDGAGAVMMRPKPADVGVSLKIEWILQRSYANEIEACMYAGGLKEPDGTMRGWRTFTQQEWLSDSVFSVKQDVKLLNANVIDYTVVKPVSELVESGRLDGTTIDYFLPHYSSQFFRERVFAGMQKGGCEIPYEKWFTNLVHKGNTGSASIYIMLEELFHSGKLQPGQRVLCYIPESGRFSSAFMLLSVVSHED